MMWRQRIGPFGEVRTDPLPRATARVMAPSMTVLLRFCRRRSGRDMTRMTRSRTLFTLLVVALLATMVAPAGAARSSDPRAARDAARARKAKLASELNTLKASEGKLLDAAKVLNDQVLSQAARVDAARQAVKAANAELAEADRSLKETRSSIDRLSHLVVERAVAAYMSPANADPNGLGDTKDLAVAARKEALLSSVAAGDTDLIDELRAARQDYALQLSAAEAAKARASARRAETEARLAALEKARVDQHRVTAAVTARQREVLSEIDAQSKSESALTRLIAQRSKPATGGVGTTARNAGGCIWPARGRVTSEYGRRWGRLHAGIDIGAPTGTPIWAAKAGTVIFSGQQSGYGNVIIIDHGGGMTTLYGHQSRRIAQDGQHVSQGQLIGKVGSTGHSTGSHVHFETRYGGTPRNPRGCLR
ncbi:MAG: Peptidase [Actinomycetia bacterium]|nr:Peptidase [Actinomycetes bacterium]